MSITPIPSHLPRAGIDPIDSHEAAMALIAMAIHRPFRHETIVITLDQKRRGISIVVVDDTTGDDDVIGVVTRIANAACYGDLSQPVVDAVIVASVRPGVTSPAVAEADIDRYLELFEIADDAAVELVEWYVIGSRITCPRDLLGAPPRW